MNMTERERASECVCVFVKERDIKIKRDGRPMCDFVHVCERERAIEEEGTCLQCGREIKRRIEENREIER